MTSVTFSPNGQFVASGSYDDPKLEPHPLIAQGQGSWGTRTIEDAENEVKRAADRACSLGLPPPAYYKPWRADGKVVIKCVSENRKSGKIRARVISAGHSESWNVQFPRDIRTSGKCFVVDYNDRGCYTSRGNIREETAQDRLAAIAKNRVRVWSVSEGTCQALCGHSGWVRSVAFSPDGKFIASCSDDKTVRMWSASKGTCLNIFTGHR